MSRAVVHLVLLLALVVPAWATTAAPRDLKCPVCGTAVKGVSIGSTNTFGGVDRDLLRRAAGSQPLLLLPATCPKCHYSQWSGDFDKPLSDDVKKAVEGGALHVPTFEGSDLPVWVKHDLIAQVLTLQKASDEKIAWQYLNTSWAVRLTSNPFQPLVKDESLVRLLKGTGIAQGDNLAQYRVEAGRALAASLRSQPESDRMAAALLAGSLLRAHGEFPSLLAALPAILETLPAEQRADLQKCVMASVALEQGYQEKALAHLTKRFSGDAFKDPEEKAVMLYLAGELYRRLGHPQEALKMYDEALAGKRPEGLEKWVREQRALVAPK